MTKLRNALLVLTFAGCAASANASPPPDAASVLRDADLCRMPLLEGRIKAIVSLVSWNATAPDVTFDINFARNGARRMETLSGPRRGQRILLTNEGYWLVMPGGKNAVRLNQLQRLLGQASFGDVGRLRFADDYDVQDVTALSSGLLIYRLVAHDRANPYRSVLLTIDAANRCPIEARFMYPSGKTFKDVRFGPPSHADGQFMIRETRFVDQADPSRYSLIRYTDLEAVDLREDSFTPASLAGADK